MKRRQMSLVMLGLASAGFAASGAAQAQQVQQSAQAQPEVAAPAASASTPAASVPGWDAMLDGLRGLPGEMLARLPERLRADPQVRAEVGRLALSAVTSYAIEALGADGDHPTFLPSIGQILSIGQPNADTVYRSARITPGGVYRLRGTRGDARIATIALSAPMSTKPQSGASPNLGPQKAVYDLNTLKVDKDGRFDVILSPERPAGHTGDWWRTTPETATLLLRLVSSDWGKETDPTLSIERVDAPVTRARAPAAELERRLRALPAAATFIGTLLLGQPEKLRREGYVNRFKGSDFAQQGGLAKQYYYESAYDLAPDEALIIEVKTPARCAYRSLILTNDIYETTDWTNNLSSLNDSQSKPDADGVLRVVVSARDPGVPNWLDTAGYPTGAIQGRWFDCDTLPIPTATKVNIGEVRKRLPRDTPSVSAAERERTIRERRAAYEQRAKW